MKKTIKYILWGFVSIFFVLVTVEVALRALGFSHNLLYMLYDKHCYWRLGPNQKIDFIDYKKRFKTQRVNSLGARGKEFDLKKPKGKKRILCVGDSFTYGWEVGDNETFPAYLQAILDKEAKNFQVLNFGCNGYTILHEVNFVKYYGLAYEPDFVLVAASLTDFNDIQQLSKNLKHMLKPGYNTLKIILSKTAIGNVIIKYRNSLRSRHVLSKNNPSWGLTQVAYAQEFSKNSLEVYLNKLDGLIELSRANNFKIIYLVMPWSLDLPETSDMSWATGDLVENYLVRDFFDDVLNRYGEEIIFVELMTPFRDEDLFLPDSHLNPKGNQLAADVIYKEIEPFL